MDPKAELQMRELGIRYRIGAGGVVADSRRDRPEEPRY
jgi:hypothetical protein